MTGGDTTLSATLTGPSPPSPSVRSPEQELTLLELLDRVLDKGVVLSGEVTLSVADVDLVYLGLRVLLSSVEAAERLRADQPTGGG
jgi:hypothetical protein